MDKLIFERHLIAATQKAIEFAKEYIEEDIPGYFKYRVCLNSSYDARVCSEETVFPEESAIEKKMETACLKFDEVVGLLWRDGKVPEWINISVVDVIGEETLIELVCCGRFTANEQLLYHRSEKLPPFEVCCPCYPPERLDSATVKFSIHHNPVCWTKDDLTRLCDFSAKVTSLTIYGIKISEEMLGDLPVLPNLRILHLSQFALTGEGLIHLGKHPSLIRLCITYDKTKYCDFYKFPIMPKLKSLELENLPEEVMGLGTLGEKCLELDHFQASARQMPKFDAEMKQFRNSLEWFSLEFPELPKELVTCASDVINLSLHFQEANDKQLINVATRFTNLENLVLRGTPITDLLLEAAADWAKLEYIDVVDTAVSSTGIKRFLTTRPTVRVMGAGVNV